MKRLFVTGLIAALAVSSVAQAELELSGNVTTVTVYQHDDKDAAGLGAGGATQGDLGIANAANADHFRFVVDQVELDLENEFGENIRARADVDFRDVANTALRAADALDLEQGYVTANLAAGNGIEFLVGKFNAPLGLESADRAANVFSTYTPGWAYLNPVSVIGTKLYYEFNDNWNFDFALVNNLNGGFANSAYPTAITRLGLVWGDEGNESYVNLGLAVGPEHNAASGGSNNAHWDYYGVLWGNWAFGDYWDLGWEAQYRQSNSVTAGANQKAIAGQLFAVWQASDVWSLQLRGASLYDVNPAAARGGSGASTTGGTWGGFEGITYSGTLGATYQIADGANLKLEGRWDYANTAGAALNADFMTGAAEFAYSF